MLGSLNRGGTETLMLDTLRKKVLLPDCICVYRKTGVLEDDFRKTEVRLEMISPDINIIKYLRRLRTFIRFEKVNIVHAQQPIDALYAILACYGLNIKVLLTLHGFDHHSGFIGKLILKYVLPKTAANLYVSKYVKGYYTKKYKLVEHNQLVIYNGIDVEKLQIKQQVKKELRLELGLNKETSLMGMVGNFVPVRDPMTVCRFLNLLNQKAVDFHFVFAGKKADSYPHIFDDCIKYCQIKGLDDRVSFLGPRTDIPSLLNQLDAFIYATDHDTFGIAVVEAMVAGVPVFVNDWEVMNEITEFGKLATIYETKTKNVLLEIFIQFFENKHEYINKALFAKKHVIDKYSIEHHIDNLVKLYESCLSSDIK